MFSSETRAIRAELSLPAFSAGFIARGFAIITEIRLISDAMSMDPALFVKIN
ncbi:MAG: hypothetical protein LBG87_02745 [Spirochaetaceae bacterium]|nr:hypothetical protein [Spirochaetaceae bacterium]